MLFGGVNIDAFFLEYDNDRSGDFAPLRYIRPGHQQVVLGLITTKNGELENPEGVKARLQEAAQYVPLAQICLSPQCGFASTEEGNSLTEAQQWDKSAWSPASPRRSGNLSIAQRCTILRQRCAPTFIFPVFCRAFRRFHNLASFLPYHFR